MDFRSTSGYPDQGIRSSLLYVHRRTERRVVQYSTLYHTVTSMHPCMDVTAYIQYGTSAVVCTVGRSGTVHVPYKSHPVWYSGCGHFQGGTQLPGCPSCPLSLLLSLSLSSPRAASSPVRASGSGSAPPIMLRGSARASPRSPAPRAAANVTYES